eukprot:scaffold15128_cov72-Skeletonema_marinoi.AAC.2
MDKMDYRFSTDSMLSFHDDVVNGIDQSELMAPDMNSLMETSVCAINECSNGWMWLEIQKIKWTSDVALY